MILSSYWVVSTVSMTGFGDIMPVTIAEMVVGVVCMFCSAFVLSFILSVFTSGITSLTRTRRKYMHQVSLLVKHLSNIGLSETRKTQVLMYFQALWEISRGVLYHKSWKNLPLSMQIEVAFALFGKTLLKVPFFKDSTQKIFTRQLCSRVVHSLYIPGSYIQRVGEPGESMFVVYKGVVSGSLTMANNEPDLVAIYNPGDAFGRFAAFFHRGQYKKSYRAETITEILEVKQRDILYLAKMFPQFKKLVSDYIEKKYQSCGTNKSIFDQPPCKKRGFDLQTETLFMKAAAFKNAFPENTNHEEKIQREKENVNNEQKMIDEYIKQQRESDEIEEDINRNETQSCTSEKAEQRAEEKGMTEESGEIEEEINEDLEERKIWKTVDPDMRKIQKSSGQEKHKKGKRMNGKR